MHFFTEKTANKIHSYSSQVKIKLIFLVLLGGNKSFNCFMFLLFFFKHAIL